MSRASWICGGLCLAAPLVVFGLLTVAGCGSSSPPAVEIAKDKPGSKKNPPGSKDTSASSKNGAGRQTATDTNGAREPADARGDAKAAQRSNGDSKKPAGTVTPAAHQDDDRPPTLKPVVDGWEKPAAVLVLSGEQHGYFEPCGCTATQSGGMSRRADLFRQLRQEKGWAVAGLDLGGLPKRERKQSYVKFDTMRTALRDMGYLAQAFGPEELRLTTDYLLSVGLPPEGSDQKHLPFLAANVVLFDSPELGTPERALTQKVGGLTIGVTAILDPALKSEIVPEGNQEPSFKIEPMEPAVRAALATLTKRKADYLVLLSHGSIATAKKLAETFPEFDLILSAGGPEDPDTKPVRAEKPMIVTVGHKGKHVGVLGIYPNNKDEPSKFELVNLDKWRFQDTKSMRDLMFAYQSRLLDEKTMTQEGALLHPTGRKFLGAAKCGECHSKTFEFWKTTRHAHAFESLDVGGAAYREGPKKGTHISRAFDAECLACHVTGWNPQEMLRFDDGYLPPEWVETDEARERMASLRGNQCENCHGPGSRHVELMEKWTADSKSVTEAELATAKKDVLLTLTDAKNKVCGNCHDPDNSPKFNSRTFDEYWEQVKHPWRD